MAPLDSITYTGRNTSEVVAWLKARGIFAECKKCGGTGEYEGAYGPVGCAPCCSRLVAVRQQGHVRYVDYGDTIAFDGVAVEIARAPGSAEA